MDLERYKRFFQVANFSAVVLTIVVNGLANALPLNNKYTGELSDSYPNLFVPAGITFAIWGLIYLLLVCFAVYQIRDVFSKESHKMSFLYDIGIFFMIASAGNIAWIFFWHYEMVGLSLVAMLVLLVSLILIYQRLDIGRTRVSRIEKACVHIPMSVYLGWITVATIANVTALLVSVGWGGFGIIEEVWTIAVLVVATLITLIMVFYRHDWAYGLVVVWALLGIVIKRLNPDPVFGVQTTIAYTAAAALIIIVIAILLYSVSYVQMKKIMRTE